MQFKHFRALLFAPVLLLLMVPLGVLAAPVLVDPDPIAVPPGLSDKAVATAIRVGVSKRGWIISRQGHGYMEATLHLRSHVARIGIKYDVALIQINYLDSQNLDYEVKGSVRHIHRNYLKWVTNVVHDINVELQAAVPEPKGT